jgi:elongin-A
VPFPPPRIQSIVLLSPGRSSTIAIVMCEQISAPERPGDWYLHDRKMSNTFTEITDFGELSYPTIRRILLRVDSAAQLRAIEEASPHLELDDGECWIRLINRDFPVLHAQHQFEPRNPASWHRVYAKYDKLNAQSKAEAAEKLKNAFAGIKQKKEANMGKIASFDARKLPKPPSDMNYIVKKAPAGPRGGRTDTGELRFSGGTRTNTSTGKGVMRKVKREMAEIAARSKLMTPGGALVARKGQIRKPPQGMVHDKIVENQPAVTIRPPASINKKPEYQDRAMQEREARLRKAKTANKNATIIEDSDLDEEEEDTGGGLDADDLEAMFDEDLVESSSARPDPSQTRKPAALPGKRNSLLSNAHRTTATSTRPVSKSTPATATKPISTASASQSTGPSSPPRPVHSGSPDLKPRMPPKRKPVDVFMKPKAKVQRR